MSTGNASQATLRERARLLDIAVAAAHDAASTIRRFASDVGAITWRQKMHADFVSEVDVAAEASIRERILRDIPDAAIMGEECSPLASLDGGIAFVVDPLDGTTNFLHGYPAYAVSIGVLVASELVAGVVIDVPRNAVFSATAGGGAMRDGATIRVSPITEPSRSLVGTGFPFKQLDMLDRYARQFSAVTRATAGIRRAGAAALDLADVACGRFEAFWELSLAPWDFAAGMLLIREAGGRVTTLDGEPPELVAGPIVAGNPAMHAWLLDTLSRTHEAPSA